MARRMGLSSGANPSVWRRSRLPRGSGRAIKNGQKWSNNGPKVTDGFAPLDNPIWRAMEQKALRYPPRKL